MTTFDWILVVVTIVSVVDILLRTTKKLSTSPYPQFAFKAFFDHLCYSCGSSNIMVSIGGKFIKCRNCHKSDEKWRYMPSSGDFY